MPVARLLPPRLMLPNSIKQVLRQGAKSNVTVYGHVKSVRHLKNVGFADILDGSGKSMAAVFKDPLKFLEAYPLKVGQSIAAVGQVTESRGKGQEYELLMDSVKIIGDVPDSYPIQKKKINVQTLRSLPTLRHRTQTLASVLRLRLTLEARLLKFFVERDFIKVNPPVLTSLDCEGAGETFKVEKSREFFEKDTYLTVLSQLHLEVLSQLLSRVWTLTPCFRAEMSHTNRHLSEFWMLEAEISFIDDVQQLTNFVESMIKLVVANDIPDLIDLRFDPKDREEISRRFELMRGQWNTIKYLDAIDLIAKYMPGEANVVWGDSISTAHEKWLAGSQFKLPVFITDYPQEQKPFYMPKLKIFDESRPTVACFDLIIPEIGELVGGSLREWQLDPLKQEMLLRGMNIDDMQWYLSLRENGTVPHGGFGLGFERLVCYLSAMDNVKDVIPFPRVPESCTC